MKCKSLLLTLVFLIRVLFLQAQPAGGREVTCMDNNWKFSFGHAGDPARDFNFGTANIFSKSGKAEGTAIDPKFSDSGWRTLDLPHDWAVELPFVNSPDFDVQSHGYKPVGGLFPETSIGWYRKHFTIGAADSGRRFSVRFDGVFRDARFWINGFYLGRNESGYVGVTWDVTDYVVFGHDNILTVRVDATQYEGWFYEGAGIYRHVWLSSYDNFHFRENGIFIWSESGDHDATVYFETTVLNRGRAAADGSVVTRLIDRNGKVAAEAPAQSIFLEPGHEKTLKSFLMIRNPDLWSPENPYLYRAVAVLSSNGRITDSVAIRTGIRTIRFEAGKGFFLNGKNIKIKGVCCHQDHAGVGIALPDYLQYYRIGLLKQMGVNAYRTSHNAPTPELLDACDSLGMLVLDEQRLLNSSPEYMDQFERLILRDRNHPSVVLWSVGNEEGYIQTNGIGKRIALSLIGKQKLLDPARTCTYGADLPNYFTGINEVIPVRGFNYRQFAVADYIRDHPEQPVIGTEMGSTVTTRGINEKDTIRCYLPDQDITAPWWASRAEEWWTLCADQPGFLGGFVWTGFDYRGEPTPFTWPNINSHFGIMDMCGFPKNIYYYYQSWWNDEDIVHLSPHWNRKGSEGKPVTVWVNSNMEVVELKLNGKSLGRKPMEPNRHLEWIVPYEPGRLEATGYRGGRETTALIETTGEPYRIILSEDKSVLRADGSDATVINIGVADNKGRPVPDAGNLIRFSLTGDARIIGTGNGDPSSHEPDRCEEGKWQRTLFSGRCQAIIQSGRNAGKVIFEAVSEGLVPASKTIILSR